MKKFEYFSVGILTEDSLKSMGDDGWEFICKVALNTINSDFELENDRPRYYFKREKSK